MNVEEIAKIIAIVQIKRTIMIDESHDLTVSAKNKIEMAVKEYFPNLEENQKNKIIELSEKAYLDESRKIEDEGGSNGEAYSDYLTNKRSFTNTVLADAAKQIDITTIKQDQAKEDSAALLTLNADTDHTATMKKTENNESSDEPAIPEFLKSDENKNVQEAKTEEKMPEPTSNFTQEKSQEKTTKKIDFQKINQNLLSTVNQTLKTATSGQFQSFKELFGFIEDTINVSEREKLLFENERNNFKANGSAINPSTPVIKKSATQTLNDEKVPVTWIEKTESAHKLFANFVSPEDLYKLKFPITYYEWIEPQPALITKDRIPENYTFDADSLVDMLWAIDTGSNSGIVGPPGCGKTVGSRVIAHVLQMPFYRIPCDGELTRREIIGGMKAINGETIWYDGLLTTGVRYPSLIVLDEIDRIDPDLQYTMHQALERDGITILEDEGRYIPVNKRCAFLGTANTMGKNNGDDNYQMKTELSEAIRDRINIWIRVSYLSEKTEKLQIINDFPYVKPETADKIITVANTMRNAFMNHSLSTVCSYRQIETICKRLEWQEKVEPQKKQSDLIIDVMKKILQKRAASEEEESSIKEMISLVSK